MESEHSQTWNPTTYAESGRFVSDLGEPVLEWLAPQPKESILDLGCGDGALTEKLAARDCNVTGVDASPEMVLAAQSRGLHAFVCDGHEMEFVEAFDAVFSNAALHWMTKPEAVIAGVWRALKPGGRFAGEFGGHGNVALIVQAVESALGDYGLHVRNPWFFPTPEEYSAYLAAAGFAELKLQLIPRPTPLPGDAGDWVTTFAQPFLKPVPESERPNFLRDVVAKLRPVLCDDTGKWTADYVRLRFSAVKPLA